MANILRGYGLAREQGYFKQEQEADVQRHRKRLIKEGKLSEEEAAALDSRAQQAQQGPAGQDATFRDSEHSFEVLPEVLQQSARLHDPHALRRREYERRVKGEPPPLSEADMMRARSKIYALGASVGHVPRMSMGRARWSPASAGGGGGDELWVAQNVRQLTPEAREVASRTYVAGVRALVYGSLLGALGLAAATTYAIRAADIKSGEDLGDRIRGALGPLSASLRSWLVPYKDRAQAWVAAPSASAGHGEGGGDAQGAELAGGLAGAASGGGGGGATGEFQRRMQQRYNTRRGGDEDGSGGAGGDSADI